MRSCREGVLANDEDPDLDAALASPEMDLILWQGRSPQPAAGGAGGGRGGAAEQQPAELRTQEYEPYTNWPPVMAHHGPPVTAPAAADPQQPRPDLTSRQPPHSPYGRRANSNPAGASGGGRQCQPSAWDYPLPRAAAAEEVVDLSSEEARNEEVIQLD